MVQALLLTTTSLDLPLNSGRVVLSARFLGLFRGITGRLTFWTAFFFQMQGSGTYFYIVDRVIFTDTKRDHVSWISSHLQPRHEGTIHHSKSFFEKKPMFFQQKLFLVAFFLVPMMPMVKQTKTLKRRLPQLAAFFRTPSSHCPFQSKIDGFATRWRLQILSTLDALKIYPLGSS